MKKLLLIVLLMFSTTALADHVTDEICTEMTVRYTIFLTLAADANTREEYQSALYKILLNGNADKQTKDILVQLIDLAWVNRKKDFNDSAMTFYRICTSGKSV